MYLTGAIDDRAIIHGFFGRRGGVSRDLYASLNCGLGSDDDPALVAENRRRAADALGFDAAALQGVRQVHGTDCVTLAQPQDTGGRPLADALITERPGLLLGILTADCAPVLFAGKKADGTLVVGAAHAGWRGALGGVLDSTVRSMRDLGATGIRAAIGPCIAQESYEVGADFSAAFTAGDRQFFRTDDGGRCRFDLPGYAAFRLGGLGVDAVWQAGRDTYALADDYFSYRRTTHRGEPDYGRQLSLIAIR